MINLEAFSFSSCLPTIITSQPLKVSTCAANWPILPSPSTITRSVGFTYTCSKIPKLAASGSTKTASSSLTLSGRT